jgi:hypothetical protein
VTLDPATLAAFEGTYRFASSSSRDKQEPFGGLGIQIAMQDGLLKVLSPIPDAPAAKAGVMANDIITHLDDEATRGITLNQALEKMRGPVNTESRLRIVRKGQDEPIGLTIVRAPIRVAGADLQVAFKDGKLQIEGRGALPVLDFEQGAVVPMSSNEFRVDGGDHTRMAFLHDGAGKPTGLVLNPGPWQIRGQRINCRVRKRREGPGHLHQSRPLSNGVGRLPRALAQRVEVDVKEIRIGGSKSVLLRTLAAA